MQTETTPRVYAGTCAKYNKGSIAGKWLDLTDYADHDEFIEACKELHSDEPDPELMFQDFENIPDGYCGECWIKADLWEWMELDDDDKAILAAYVENCGAEGATIEGARDSYLGTFDSLADYVQDSFEQGGDWKEDYNWLHPSRYVDWERMARDLKASGDVWTKETDDGVMVFQNC